MGANRTRFIELVADWGRASHPAAKNLPIYWDNMTKPGLLVLAAAMTLAYATDPIPRAEYHQRRADLRKNLEGTLILFGYVEGHDEVYRRPQNSDFYYLTGWVQP